MAISPLLRFDRKVLCGHTGLLGVDEAGRGALAGPMTAAAVWAPEAFIKKAGKHKATAYINDSKQLKESEREKMFEAIQCLQDQGHILFAWAEADIETIENNNIYGATQRAMEACLAELESKVEDFPQWEPGELFASTEKSPCILIDGRPFKKFKYPHQGIIGGDGKSLTIAMASIVAKVMRDRRLRELDSEYPEYAFKKHKGYGTQEHRTIILERGPCAIHRPSFLKKILSPKPKVAPIPFTDNEF